MEHDHRHRALPQYATRKHETSQSGFALPFSCFRDAYWLLCGGAVSLEVDGVFFVAGLLLHSEESRQQRERIVVLIDDTFLERDDRVVRDGDVFGTDLGAALG